MAIINSLRFGSTTGAVCIDSESWFLMRRKTHLADGLYPLVPDGIARRLGTQLVYGGVGHPAFHGEVARRARRKIRDRHGQAAEPVPARDMAPLVLEALQEAHRRRIDDRMRFLYGFDRDELNQGSFQRGGERTEIRLEMVRKRARRLARGEEDLGRGPLTPRNHALLVAVDPRDGFTGYCLKEEDGVLSFQSCGFDTVGQGRYGAAAVLGRELNRRTVHQRRAGLGAGRGLLQLLLSMLEPAESYGQVGGSLHLILLDAEGAFDGELLKPVTDEPARLAREIALACRHGLLPEPAAEVLLEELGVGRDDLVRLAYIDLLEGA